MAFEYMTKRGVDYDHLARELNRLAADGWRPILIEPDHARYHLTLERAKVAPVRRSQRLYRNSRPERVKDVV
jgi:hypothetical protein